MFGQASLVQCVCKYFFSEVLALSNKYDRCSEFYSQYTGNMSLKGCTYKECVRNLILRVHTAAAAVAGASAWAR